jgi:hypothetical protein
MVMILVFGIPQPNQTIDRSREAHAKKCVPLPYAKPDRKIRLAESAWAANSYEKL